MGQSEYSVGLGAKPDEMKRIAIAFRAGQQKERDRIRNQLAKMENAGTARKGMGQLVWSTPLIDTLGVGDYDKSQQEGPQESQS